jgi:hypothetical protein
MGAKAREKIKKDFSQEAMVKSTLQWYGLNLSDQAGQSVQTSDLRSQPEPIAGHQL